MKWIQTFLIHIFFKIPSFSLIWNQNVFKSNAFFVPFHLFWLRVDDRKHEKKNIMKSLQNSFIGCSLSVRWVLCETIETLVFSSKVIEYDLAFLYSSIGATCTLKLKTFVTVFFYDPVAWVVARTGMLNKMSILLEYGWLLVRIPLLARIELERYSRSLFVAVSQR